MTKDDAPDPRFDKKDKPTTSASLMPWANTHSIGLMTGGTF